MSSRLPAVLTSILALVVIIASTESAHAQIRTFRTGPDWERILEAAASETNRTVSRWAATARFRNIDIVGSRVWSDPGCVAGCDRLGGDGLIVKVMVDAGLSEPFASAFVGALGDAWSAWCSGLRARELILFPTFDAYPSPTVEPTPSQPVPIGAFRSRAEGRLSAPSLERAIKERFPRWTVVAGADAAIVAYARWIESSFQIWKGRAEARNLIGTGTVPSWHPFSQSGQVVGSIVSPSGEITPVHLGDASRILDLLRRAGG